MYGEIINISFEDRKLGKQIADDAAGRRRWGEQVWRSVKRRIASLLAAPTLADMQMVPGDCHQLTGDRRGQFAVRVTGALRLVFVPDHSPVPRHDDGGIDQSAVTRIRIVEIVNYHGK